MSLTFHGKFGDKIAAVLLTEITRDEKSPSPAYLAQLPVSWFQRPL